MKKFFIGVGKAALYFGAYFGGQLVVSFGISMVLAVVAMLSVMKPDGTYDMTAYMNRFNVMLNDWLYVIMVISGILTILTFWIVTLIRKKKFLKEASLVKFKPSTVAPIIIGGISLNFAISFLLNFVPFPQSWIESYEASSSELLGGAGILMWISVVIMAPLVEELTFRGFMYSRLKTGMAKWIAIIITSLVFGIVHGTIIWAIYTFIFSLVLISVLERTKSLWGSILLHMSFNLVGATMSTWPNMLDNVNEWIIFIASIVLTAGCAVWFMLLTKKKKEEVNNTQISENQMV